MKKYYVCFLDRLCKLFVFDNFGNSYTPSLQHSSQNLTSYISNQSIRFRWHLITPITPRDSLKCLRVSLIQKLTLLELNWLEWFFIAG